MTYAIHKLSSSGHLHFVRPFLSFSSALASCLLFLIVLDYARLYLMGFFSTLLGILGFVIGSIIGIVIGFYLFIYTEPGDVEDPKIRTIDDSDTTAMEDLISEIPWWVKNPDYERVDWLNKFILQMWPFIDKAIHETIRSIAQPIFAEYIGMCKIESIELEKIDLGTLPPSIHGLKIYETNENELVMEPAIKWAGNPNIIVAMKLLSRKIIIQLVELQVIAAPRISLKPLVPTFPCFTNIMVSLMEKPHVDFGLKILGGDIMSIPGLYRYVQDTIKRQVSSLYLWPRFLDIPILDASTVAAKRPVGILHVRVVRAMKLLKMDLLGQSDPYVKLSLSGDRLPAKKTTIKKKTLYPEWDENFKLIVKEPQSQVLIIDVYDWDKVGAHDKLGMQIYPLNLLNPNERKEITLDLLKSTDVTRDAHNKKQRGQIVLEVRYAPFKEDTILFSGPLDGYSKRNSRADSPSSSENPSGAGLLMVTVYGAEDVEGSRHNNPYILLIFRGEQKKSKTIRKTRDPQWNEEFQFVLDEPPISDKIHIEVMSKRTRLGFRSTESLGHVDVNLRDVVHNGRINEKYHLIDSKKGLIHVELRWKVVWATKQYQRLRSAGMSLTVQ